MRHRKQMIPRKPKDILEMTLRNMVVGDEVVCTLKTYEAIKDRVNNYSLLHSDRRLAIMQWGGVKKLKRAA